MPGAVLLLGFVLYPYVYMTARALFAVQSANLIEVARTLGAGPLEMFRTVALPLARPALALGLSLALLETLNDIGATEYLGVRTLTVSIYTTWVNRGSLEGAAQIACAMLAVVAFILWLERRGRGARRFSASVKRPRQATPQPLQGWRGVAASLACALPVTIGFLIPAVFLMREAAIRTLRTGVHPDFAHAARLHHRLCGCRHAGGRRAGRRGRRRSAAGPPARASALLARIAALGYAMPGTVLAVGLLWPLAGIDNALANAVARRSQAFRRA